MGSEHDKNTSVLHDPSAYTIAAGDLAAIFLPHNGMLGASLRFRGVELLRRLENLDTAAVKGSTAGIPILYPWANRLGSLAYSAAGRNVELAATSTLLHFDDHGLPLHGVPWGQLQWSVIQSSKNQLVARLDWNRSELLTVFPFRHQVEMTATIQPNELAIQTLVRSTGDTVPISFGYHPYFGIPELGRASWRLKLPAMRRLLLNPLGIPAGERENCPEFDAKLGDADFDDCFEVLEERPSFSLSGPGLWINVEFVEGYRYAQIFAPKNKQFAAIEPMTAPTNALKSGRGLSEIARGGEYKASFRIGVHKEP
jgi:aldose 1-epimerase